jgi:TonB-dependent SusC/RagA subfamily outer membrane receptor
MYTPRPRRPMQWLAVTTSIAVAACASQPAPLALQPTLLPANVRLTRLAPGATVSAATAPTRGDISLAESAHYVHIEQLLMARAPGLEVRSLGQGQFTLSIRGRPSLGDRREPLVVIDGTQYPENGAEVLAAMTPRDVKRVEVLRDAASTSVYGTRGTSGVLLVTSRRGDY